MTSIPLDTLVELRDQYSDVYPASPTGARGWVRARRELPKTDPEVYIEWDKTHWRYHGERDGWTFAHHFRPVVDEPIPMNDMGEFPSLDRLIEHAASRVEHARCRDCGEFHDEDSDFIDTLVLAQESLLDSDAYFIVAVRPRREDGRVVYAPEIFSEVLDVTAKSVIEAQLLVAATEIFERHLAQTIAALEARE